MPVISQAGIFDIRLTTKNKKGVELGSTPFLLASFSQAMLRSFGCTVDQLGLHLRELLQ